MVAKTWRNNAMQSPAMRRRRFLGTSAASLAAPRIAQAQGGRLLKFIPQSDLSVLDPVWSAAYVVRNHALMVFDTLYGVDQAYRIQPQMVEGHRVEDDGKTWLLTLRDGLFWHDREKVLARDCVASIRRWGARDSFGQTLMAATSELTPVDDRTIRFRLARPFPLLPAALGKPGTNVCVMMPERLANTDPFKQVSEMIGSGPFRFIAEDRVPGSLVAYERTRPMSRAPTAHRVSPPVRRSSISTASSGMCCRIPPPPRPRCALASRIGGKLRRSICCRCCGKREL
jgi:peptide/nickel transport system substrate-binding protein